MVQNTIPKKGRFLFQRVRCSSIKRKLPFFELSESTMEDDRKRLFILRARFYLTTDVELTIGLSRITVLYSFFPLLFFYSSSARLCYSFYSILTSAAYMYSFLLLLSTTCVVVVGFAIIFSIARLSSRTFSPYTYLLFLLSFFLFSTAILPRHRDPIIVKVYHRLAAIHFS